MHPVLTFQTGTPTTGPATVRIGEAPPLTQEQLVGVLIAGGVPYPRALFAAASLLKGTAYPRLVQRTAQDFMNEIKAKELREDKAVLLRVVRAKLSPLLVKALDTLTEHPHGTSSGVLAEEIGVSPQHGGNLCADLLALGLVERKHVGSPHPDFTGPGRTPYWWTVARAVREDGDE